MNDLAEGEYIDIPDPRDLHVHFRGYPKDDSMPTDVERVAVRCSTRQFGSVILEPNTLKEGNLFPVTTPELARAYKQRIMRSVPVGTDCAIYCLCYLNEQTIPEDIVRGYRDGDWIGTKGYFKSLDGHGTTGSHGGIATLQNCKACFEAMQKEGIPAQFHFEVPDGEVDEFDREIIAIERYFKPLRRDYPGMKISMEHVSTKKAIDYVKSCDPKVTRAALTPHHALWNRNRIFRNGLNPLYWCKPVLKREEDRAAVAAAMTSGDQHFHPGSDSAPWEETHKAKICGCSAGLFLGHATIEYYGMVFDAVGKIRQLPEFMARGSDFYPIPKTSKVIRLRRQSWMVGRDYGPIYPVSFGENIPFKANVLHEK